VGPTRHDITQDPGGAHLRNEATQTDGGRTGYLSEVSRQRGKLQGLASRKGGNERPVSSDPDNLKLDDVRPGGRRTSNTLLRTTPDRSG